MLFSLLDFVSFREWGVSRSCLIFSILCFGGYRLFYFCALFGLFMYLGFFWVLVI